MEWLETGGPLVKPSTRKGFGRFVTDQMITRALDATVETELAPDGLRWTLECRQATSARQLSDHARCVLRRAIN